MTVENMKTGFVERIGGTIFVVNAMPAENAKHTQEELVRAIQRSQRKLFYQLADNRARADDPGRGSDAG